MDEKTKIDLVNKNNRKEQYRKQKTAQEVGKLYALSKEIGILGDAVEYQFGLFARFCPDVEIDPAFTDWRNKVYEIKEKIKHNFDNYDI